MKSLVIFRRELIGFFLSPIAWVVAVATAIVLARFFENFSLLRSRATLEGVYAASSYWFFLTIPALTMGSLASEFRSGTIEMLATDPVKDWEIVAGKFCGTLSYFLFCLIPIPIFYFVLRALGGVPDWGPVMSGALGLVLAGSLSIAIGIFASSLTSQQIVAYLVAALILFVLRTTGEAEPLDIPDWLRSVLGYLSVQRHLAGLFNGRIASDDIVYFVSTSGLFLYLATRILEARRWA